MSLQQYWPDENETLIFGQLHIQLSSNPPETHRGIHTLHFKMIHKSKVRCKTSIGEFMKQPL